MRIKTLHLIKYKRFNDLRINLGDNPKKIVALVGPNGCGKSSVFDAMLFHNNAYQQIGNSGRKGNSYHSLEKNSRYDFQNIQIIFDEGDFSSARISKEKEGKENTLFSFRSSFRYNGTLNVRESMAVSKITQNDFGASSASDIDQRIQCRQNSRTQPARPLDDYADDPTQYLGRCHGCGAVCRR